MKHTQGEWKLSNGREVTSDTKIPIAKAWKLNLEESEALANAKLIAAAPDLLEALTSVLPYLKATGTNGNHWVPLVEAAIKKATS